MAWSFRLAPPHNGSCDHPLCGSFAQMSTEHLPCGFARSYTALNLNHVAMAIICHPSASGSLSLMFTEHQLLRNSFAHALSKFNIAHCQTHWGFNRGPLYLEKRLNHWPSNWGDTWNCSVLLSRAYSIFLPSWSRNLIFLEFPGSFVLKQRYNNEGQTDHYRGDQSSTNLVGYAFHPNRWLRFYHLFLAPSHKFVGGWRSACWIR